MHRTDRSDCPNSQIIRQNNQQRSRHFDIKSILVLCYFMLLCNAPSMTSFAQQSKDQGEFSRFVGDSPSKALPYATDVSPALSHKAIATTLQKVADWQLHRSQPHFDHNWTFAVLYAGFMAVSDKVGDEKYSAAMKSMGDSFQWKLGPKESDANDLAIGQTYMALFKQYKDPNMLQPATEQVDRMIQQSDSRDRPLWWWCDALFMAPPLLAELSQITNRQK